MSDDRSKLYEVLGLAPGASREELKAAHRDLAKVWHPDRFAHDPRLQVKAQEKLKEINEAYDELISDKPRRPKPAPEPSFRHREYAYRPSESARAGRSSRIPLLLVAVVIFAAGFYFTSRWLIDRNRQHAAVESSIDNEVPPVDVEASDESGQAANGHSARPKDRPDASAAETNLQPAQDIVVPTTVMPTKTVLIDPETGMLARAECPLKSRTTFVEGNEPHQYCTSHTPELAAAARQKDSKIKSAAKRLASPTKWFDDKEKTTEQTKPAAKVQ